MCYSSSLLIQSAAAFESLGHMTWKLLKKHLLCINLFMQSNLMTVPKSASSDPAQGSGRWVNRPPAANTRQTSVKSRLDPSEYPPIIQPETNFTLVWWVTCCSLWIGWQGFQSLNLNGDCKFAIRPWCYTYKNHEVFFFFFFCGSTESPAAECIWGKHWHIR